MGGPIMIIQERRNSNDLPYQLPSSKLDRQSDQQSETRLLEISCASRFLNFAS